MNVALGVFQFDCRAGVADRSYSARYCSQALLPFLAALSAIEAWRCSVAISGATLDYLDAEFPRALRQLRALIESGRLELISPTYFPALWIAFPRRDMLANVERNVAALKALGLPAGGGFLGHEGLFGMGVASFSGLFDYSVCGDQHAASFCGARLQPAYLLGDMLVVLGSNHLSGLLSKRTHWKTGGALPSGFHSAALVGLMSTVNEVETSITRVERGGKTAFWYHFGSGHCFATHASPSDRQNFFHDREWSAHHVDSIKSLHEGGYVFSTVREYAESIDRGSLGQLPYIAEGCWSPSHQRSLHHWLGQRDPGRDGFGDNRSLVWRARAELMQLEETAKKREAPEDAPSPVDFKALWASQLAAEDTEIFGARANPADQARALVGAEGVLSAATARLLELDAFARGPYSTDVGSSLAVTGLSPTAGIARLLGADGDIHGRRLGLSNTVIEAIFIARGPDCGISFTRTGGTVTYCPSCAEDAPLTLSPQELLPAHIFLPLANGLISLAASRFLVRVNGFCQVPARVSKTADDIAFILQGAAKGQRFKWRFLIFDGALSEAVKAANLVNCV